MCYSAGPLLSPQHFKQFLVPHYKRITDLLAITKLLTVFETFDSEGEAVKSFTSAKV